MARKAGKVSIFTIAAELGISASTVSRVLNNRTGVGESTRCSVLELARKYNFRLNYPMQHQPIIATVISGAEGITAYQGGLLTGIYKYFATHPFRMNTIVASLLPNSPSILETVREQQCSGVIIVQSNHFAAQLPELASSGLPIMEIDNRSEQPGIGYVDNDAYSGAVELTEHLISLGHRKIGFLMRFSTELNHIQRFNGYRDALIRAGIAPQREWLVVYDDQDDQGMFHVTEMMLDMLLAQTPDVTAIIGVNDDLAIAAMHNAVKRGIKVPEQISFAGFDNTTVCQYVTPEMTSVTHPVVQAGFLAAKAVADYISSFGKKPLPRQVMPTHLVVRNSTGPVAANPTKN